MQVKGKTGIDFAASCRKKGKSNGTEKGMGDLGEDLGGPVRSGQRRNGETGG